MSYYISAESLYSQMKNLISSSIDTSENSYIYNALFPVAMELTSSLLNMDDIENKVFASKAVTSGYSTYLDLRVSEVGLTRKSATYAIVPVTFTGKVGTTISLGSIVSTNDNRLYSTISDAIIGSDGTITCNVKADASGSSYNVSINEINYLPIKYSGVTSVTNTSAYSEATDEESDDDLYDRYLTKVQNGGVRGNKSDYESLALEVTGIGSAKCIPLWNGDGTVKVIISNSNKRACDQTLIDNVYDYITENTNFGATLTVSSVEEVLLNISFSLTYDSSTYTLATMQSSIESALSTYISDLDSGTTSIKYNKILGVIVDMDNVLDISNLTINGGNSNITLSNTQIPVLGTVTIN